ncbi:phage tail protein [Metarhizobium album]|uniref:Phage tail protein n=1 Tax=Metarhizobium album TaxID=2182425 RepID=A0A2U2DU31_9HYPH|nr:tail protein X [Rhizobium album]PWE56807.1 phage tail protein [Rhizobium album]
MPQTYTTRQGETVDLVCSKFYGRTRDVTESVLAANPGLAALGAVLPLGTQIVMPDIEARPAATKLISLWD